MDTRKLARAISIVENESPGYEEILAGLPVESAQVIGLTGAPGAGKSSLTDALIEEMVSDGKKVAVLCIDPSSPFNLGALLGDRIRMTEWYNHPSVYIRSLASRGALGGLHPRIIEVTSLVRAAGFDYVIVETVGVGQSEVDIAGLADVTIVLLVPEGGDVIQTMKAGLMEIADMFVVNKYDRPQADVFYNHLKRMIRPVGPGARAIPIFKTVASERKGVSELYQAIKKTEVSPVSDLRVELTARKVWTLIQNKRMETVHVEALKAELREEMKSGRFNLFSFAAKFF